MARVNRQRADTAPPFPTVTNPKGTIVNYPNRLTAPRKMRQKRRQSNLNSQKHYAAAICHRRVFRRKNNRLKEFARRTATESWTYQEPQRTTKTPGS